MHRLFKTSRVIAISALGLCAAMTGCRTSAVLKDAAFASCGTSTAYLSGWWADLPSQSPPNHDPFGGYVFAYWVDDQDNVCSGDPGRNGVVGPAVIAAQTLAASAALAANVPITPEQLSAFQQIPMSFRNYEGSGLHFVQFYTTSIRMRADGSVWSNRSDGVYGAPVVTDIGQRSCLTPVAFKVSQGPLLPSFSDTSVQDPVRCRVKVAPVPTAMTKQELAAFHVLDLPHGGDVHDVAP